MAIILIISGCANLKFELSFHLLVNLVLIMLLLSEIVTILVSVLLFIDLLVILLLLFLVHKRIPAGSHGSRRHIEVVSPLPVSILFNYDHAAIVGVLVRRLLSRT